MDRILAGRTALGGHRCGASWPASRPAGARSQIGRDFGRRLLAFAVDVVVCDLIALLFFPQVAYWNALVFFVEVYLLTALIGASAGHRICGLYVARLDGRPVGFLWAFVRTILLCLLIPALIWDRDSRGMHDRAANTVLLRM